MTPSEEIFGEYASVGLLVLKVLAAVGLVTVLVWTWRAWKEQGWLEMLGLWTMAVFGLAFWFAMGWWFGGDLQRGVALMGGMTYLVLVIFALQGIGHVLSTRLPVVWRRWWRRG